MAPFGSNMAFRRKMFEKYGGFRTDIGPSPNREVPHFFEDVEFGGRVLAAGEKLRYEPLATIYLAVPEERVRKSFFLARCFEWGRAEARLSVMPRVHVLCSLVAWTLRWMMTVEPRKRFYHKLIVWEKMGSIVELCRQALHGTTKKERRATP